jgi:hypothetical protein
MNYKGLEYDVKEAAGQAGWKWAVFLGGNRPHTGISLTRADAVLDAELEIEAALTSSREIATIPE